MTADVALDFATIAMALGIVALIIAVPLYLTPGPRGPLTGFIIIMLCIGAVIGSLGRVIGAEANPTVDYWIRVAIIATRVAVIGAMLYEYRWRRADATQDG